jgi:AbrB family looped-hinge helix DNA binding protein
MFIERLEAMDHADDVLIGLVLAELDRWLDLKVRNSYHRGMKTTVSEKGQITIPKRLRDRLGLRPGSVLDFEEDAGRLVGRKLVVADDLDELVGILDLPGGTDAFIREIRGPGPDELTE